MSWRCITVENQCVAVLWNAGDVVHVAVAVVAGEPVHLAQVERGQIGPDGRPLIDFLFAEILVIFEAGESATFSIKKIIF